MSKKERLKAASQAQILAKKEQQEQEEFEKREAAGRQSKAAAKFRRKARRGKEPIVFLILKLLMLIPFGYSGFFYGGILISGTFGGYITPTPPKWVGWAVLLGTVAMGAGIIFEFFKKHIPSFVLILAGCISYLKGVQYFINYIQDRLEKYYVEERLRDMDKVYMKRHYPIAATAAISLIILIIWIVMKLIERRKKQYEKDTAPVKSIIEN
ncbi:MAG: hypothetical protein IJ129_02630 [Ruminococcus sp.]|nr:hypothetical protein [Ruminococcus sp.]